MHGRNLAARIAPPLSVVSAAYLDELALRRSPAYVERARGVAQGLLAGVGDIPVDQLSVPAVNAYRARRLAAGAAKATVNLEVFHLQAMLRWGRENGVIVLDAERDRALDFVVGHRRLPVGEADQRRRKRPLTEQEIDRLMATARRLDERASHRALPQAPMWATFLATGARRGELLALRWHQLDLEEGWVLIAAEGSKSARARRVAISADLVEQLERLRATGSRFLGRVLTPEDFVFRSPYGVPWIEQPDNVNRQLRRVLRHAGIPRRDEAGRSITPHALRHTCSTRLARARVSPRTAARHLGHRDVRTTLEVYTHVEDEDLRAAAEALALPSAVEAAPAARRAPELQALPPTPAEGEDSELQVGSVRHRGGLR